MLNSHQLRTDFRKQRKLLNVLPTSSFIKNRNEQRIENIKQWAFEAITITILTVLFVAIALI